VISASFCADVSFSQMLDFFAFSSACRKRSCGFSCTLLFPFFLNYFTEPVAVRPLCTGRRRFAFGNVRVSASPQEIADTIEHHEVIIHEKDRFGHQYHPPYSPWVNALPRRRQSPVDRQG
jgi:glutamine phosphoribosylpyrophosphate amidotransferase